MNFLCLSVKKSRILKAEKMATIKGIYRIGLFLYSLYATNKRAKMNKLDCN